MGSFSPLLARPLGIALPVYPAKGSSVTLPVKDADRAPQVGLTDGEFKLVFSRCTCARSGDGSPGRDVLRVAGTAEFNGHDRHLNAVSCQAPVRRTGQLLPGVGDTAQAQFWSGLRPATPSNVPLIGQTRIANLFLHTGRGTLGWTRACGSGKALAGIVSGRVPEVDFAFQGVPLQGAGQPRAGRVRPADRCHRLAPVAASYQQLPKVQAVL